MVSWLQEKKLLRKKIELQVKEGPQDLNMLLAHHELETGFNRLTIMKTIRNMEELGYVEIDGDVIRARSRAQL